MSSDWTDWLFLIVLFLTVIGWQEWTLRREDRRHRARMRELHDDLHALNEQLVAQLQRLLLRWDEVRGRQ